MCTKFTRYMDSLDNDFVFNGKLLFFRTLCAFLTCHPKFDYALEALRKKQAGEE